MASAQTVRAAFAIVTSLLIDGMLAAAALAQATPMPPPIAPRLGAPMAEAGSGGWIVAVSLVLGLLVVIGALVKIYDLRRKREVEEVHLQAQISDALLRDPNLFGLPVAATAHAPFWSGTPVTIELTGEVPDPHQRFAVERIARAEAMRIRPDVEIVDHLSVRAVSRVA
jgi:hypothetical protein